MLSLAVTCIYVALRGRIPFACTECDMCIPSIMGDRPHPVKTSETGTTIQRTRAWEAWHAVILIAAYYVVRAALAALSAIDVATIDWSLERGAC